MKKMFFIAWTLVCAQGVSSAQNSATDPAAPVPALPYVSAFGAIGAELANPDVKLTDWVSANAQTGRNLRGHVDILKAEGSEVATPVAMNTSTTALTPAQAVQSALAARPDLFAVGNMNAYERTLTNARVLQLSHGVNRAWIEAVSAGETVAHLQVVHDAAQTAVELARRMASVGNWSKAQMMQEQLVLSDATVQLAKARQQAVGSRESLVRLLGVWGEATRFALPLKLPALPATPMPEYDIEATALRNKPEMRLSSMAAQMDLEAVRAQDMQRWTQASDEARGSITGANSAAPTGDAISFSLLTQAPLLDQRKAGLSEAVERAAHSQASVTNMAVGTRSQAREAYFRYRTAFDIARHQRDVAVQLSTAMQEETQNRYNGMLQSTWDLLASARARVQSINSAQQAQRDFWLAHTDLQLVLAGGVATFSAETPDSGASATTPKGH